MRKALQAFLQSLGEDPKRPGLKKTPERYEEMLRFLTSGYAQDPQKILREALFPTESQDMVLLKDIEFYSLCEHHVLPFFGRIHIAYIPGKNILGLSKLPRLVDSLARRLQTQERLGKEIAENIQKILKPKGIAILISARHLCMSMRGVAKEHVSVETTVFRGSFRDDGDLREEFLQLLGARNPA